MSAVLGIEQHPWLRGKHSTNWAVTPGLMFFTYFLNFLLHLFMYAHVGTCCHPSYEFGRQRSTFRSQLSPSAKWIWGIKLWHQDWWQVSCPAEPSQQSPAGLETRGFPVTHPKKWYPVWGHRVVAAFWFQPSQRSPPSPWEATRLARLPVFGTVLASLEGRHSDLSSSLLLTHALRLC